MANLFTGQFFFESLDIEFFRKNARKYGFNEEEYLNALFKVQYFLQNLLKMAWSFSQN